MGGFQFHETMTGTWQRDGAPAGCHLRFQFTAAVSAADLGRYLRDRRVRIAGTVEAEGLARGAFLEGEMELDPLLGRVIGYRFRFTGDDGRAYAFRGRKEMRLLHPIRSLTTLPGALLDEDGRAVGHAALRFALRDLPAFLASFRPVV